MTLHFKPMPGLSLAVLICLPILIGLGIWQYQRWQWKQDILAEVDAAVSAPPLSGLLALADAQADALPLEFRRIQLSGQAEGPVWYLYQPAGSIQWQPFRTVTADGQTALVGFPSIEDRLKQTAPLPEIAGPRAGYVRRIRPRTGLSRWIGTDSNPAENRWFDINPDGAWLLDATYYVALDPAETDAAELPVRRPDIANNHVSYMLTWWSFAIILLIIYAILHRRAGRLSVR
ncbi:MAG: SURF1 family protein [Pseudomonadota bacterium]